jgi:hypothetical protein
MDIKPGLKKGSKIRFAGVSVQEEGGRQDLVFVVEEVISSANPTSCIYNTNSYHRKNMRYSNATMTTSFSQLNSLFSKPLQDGSVL